MQIASDLDTSEKTPKDFTQKRPGLTPQWFQRVYIRCFERPCPVQALQLQLRVAERARVAFGWSMGRSWAKGAEGALLVVKTCAKERLGLWILNYSWCH